MCSPFRNFHADASVGGDDVKRSGAGSIFAQRWILGDQIHVQVDFLRRFVGCVFS